MNKKSVWLISVTEDYFDKAKFLIKSLNDVSEHKVLLYTLNFNTEFNSDNLIKIPFNIPEISNNFKNKTPTDKFICMSSRLKAIVDAIDNGWDEIIYLDSDMIANLNVDNLFNEINNITNAPILVKGYYQYNMYDGRGNPFTEIDGEQLCDNRKSLEYSLQKRLGLHQDERSWYRQAGIMVINKDCRQFFQDCIDIAFDSEVINNWETIAPWHDETIMNVMLWKYKYNYMLPYQFLDTRKYGVDIVRQFFEEVHLKEKILSSFTNIPKEKDKKNITFFHGAREETQIKDIYEYMINRNKNILPKEAYITHVSKDYLPIVEYAIKTLDLFSDKKFILYTINCDADFDYPNLIKRRLDFSDIKEPKKVKDDGDGDSFYVDREDPDVYKFLTLKPKILLDALSNGVETGFYIDGDSLCNENIDELFSYKNKIQNYPLLTEGIFEIIGWGGKFYIEQTLIKKLGINPDNRSWYAQTGYILFNRKCLEFIKEWDELCQDDIIVSDWKNLAPYHEETIINVLFWKYKYYDRLPRCYTNILTSQTVSYFFDCDMEWDTQWRGNKLLPTEKVGKRALNNDRFLMIPKHKHQVKFFHGLKVIDELEKAYQYLKNKKKRVLLIIPHLSTGGLPQVSLKRIELIKDDIELTAICYEDAGRHWFVVQKNKINKILGDNIIYLPDKDKGSLFDIISRVNPHMIHMEEIPELFMDNSISKKLYNNNRRYNIIETCHTSTYNWNSKVYIPDAFAFITPMHINQTDHIDVPKFVIQYPIEDYTRPNRNEALGRLGLDPNKKHVLNVGLFAPGKNQKEIFDVAKVLQHDEIVFHFVGNLALNFKDYYKEFIPNDLDELPSNIRVWDERDDVDSFYSACDLFYFASKMECNPLVIKEALSWKMPIIMRDLEYLAGMYDTNSYITYIDSDINNTVSNIRKILNIKQENVSEVVTSNWMGI